MNKVILMGRLTRDPMVSYSQSQAGNGEQMAVARFTVAVDRRVARRDASAEQQTADFISCVAFGRQGEFAEKYLKQGTKICLEGRIQTGSYTNKEGNRVYTALVKHVIVYFRNVLTKDDGKRTTIAGKWRVAIAFFCWVTELPANINLL